MKKTKKQQIKEHLLKNKSITSWDAIEKYGATRLSATIWTFIHKEGMNIVRDSVTMKDRNGNSCTYAKYIYKGDKLPK
jgi:hypothetical protein